MWSDKKENDDYYYDDFFSHLYTVIKWTKKLSFLGQG